MITYKQDDMFAEKFDIYVNTINTKGAMGRGIALLFKEKYPELYLAYSKACKNNEIKPGTLWYYTDKSGDFIINFATKDDWRNPSKYEWIESGLKDLRVYLELSFIRWNVAIPALGCGNGGLSFNKIKAMIEKYLGDLNHDIVVFEPKENK